MEADVLQLLDARGVDAVVTSRLAPSLSLQLRRVRLPLVADPLAQRGVVGELERLYPGVAVLLHEPPHCPETLAPCVRVQQRSLDADALQLLAARQ